MVKDLKNIKIENIKNSFKELKKNENMNPNP